MTAPPTQAEADALRRRLKGLFTPLEAAEILACPLPTTYRACWGPACPIWAWQVADKAWSDAIDARAREIHGPGPMSRVSVLAARKAAEGEATTMREAVGGCGLRGGSHGA